jgi:hypothetical protein
MKTSIVQIIKFHHNNNFDSGREMWNEGMELIGYQAKHNSYEYFFVVFHSNGVHWTSN